MNSGFAGSMGLIPGNTLTDQLTGRPRTSLRVRSSAGQCAKTFSPAAAASARHARRGSSMDHE